MDITFHILNNVLLSRMNIIFPIKYAKPNALRKSTDIRSDSFIEMF